MSEASPTAAILASVLQQLRSQCPQWAAQLFPERPAQYRLNHPTGAVLVSYLGSRWSASADAGAVVQRREVQIALAVIARQLNGRDAAIEMLDAVRCALIGFAPAHCNQLRAVSERFLGEAAGLWQYEVQLAATSASVSAVAPTPAFLHE